MVKEDKFRNVFLAIIFAISGFLGIANGSYLITVMYILTVAAVVLFVVRDKEVYNMLYAVLLVSAFYDYALYVPRMQNIYMFHIVLGFFTLLSLFRVFRDPDIFVNLDKKVLGIYVIWFIYMCASVIWALNKSLSIKYIAIYLMMFAFIINMMIYNVNKERIKNTINILLFLISIIIIVGLIEVLLGQQLPIKHYYDSFKESMAPISLNTIEAWPIVFSFNTNNLAATIAILSPICLYSIDRFENIAAKVWFTLVACVGFSLVVITTSRTGSLATVLGLAVYIIYSIFNIRKLGIKQIIFPIVILFGFFMAYKFSYMIVKIKPVNDKQIENYNGLSSKMHSLEGLVAEGGLTEEGSALHRMEIIKAVYTGVITDKHFQGYGVGNVEQLLRNSNVNTGSVYSPHAYPIEILGDFGLPGMVLFGGYYAYLLIENLIIGIRKKSMMCLASVAGLIAFAPASFGPSSITYVFSYWILIGFSVSCIQVYRKENVGYGRVSSIKEYKSV